jgi:hypothetical protein
MSYSSYYNNDDTAIDIDIEISITNNDDKFEIKGFYTKLRSKKEWKTEIKVNCT